VNDETLELSAGIPGWTLRVWIAALGLAILGVLVNAGVGGAALILIGVVLLLCTALPASPGPALAIVLVAMSVVATGTGPFTPEMLALVPLVHLLHVSCAIAGLLPGGARVHLAAFTAPALRFLAIQAGVFALAGLMAVVPGGRSPAVLEFVAIVGVGGIAVLVLWLLLQDR
jgi:hypothetical protein